MDMFTQLPPECLCLSQEKILKSLFNSLTEQNTQDIDYTLYFWENDQTSVTNPFSFLPPDILPLVVYCQFLFPRDGRFIKAISEDQQL
jgi:hypothetical protein